MKELIPIMSVLCALSAAVAIANQAGKAAEIKRTPAHNPEQINSKGSDLGTTESVTPKLQGSVGDLDIERRMSTYLSRSRGHIGDATFY